MTLAEFFEKLSYGELSNLYIGEDGAGGIPLEKWPAIISHINYGLTALHTKFPIKERDLIIQSYDHIAKYYLRPEYSRLNTAATPKYKYIIDTPDDKFNGDVIKIIQVYNEVGDPLPMNDNEQWASVFTPGFDILQINHPSNEDAFSVLYRANHTQIPLNTTDLASVSVEIPVCCEEALLYYVAGRVFTNMGSEDHVTKGQLFLGKFETQCAFIEQEDLIHSSYVPTNIKPHLRGWI